MTITFPEVVNYLTTQASREDLAMLETTAGVRRKALYVERTAAITTGMHVELEKLSTKYMNGMSGVVQEIQRPRGGDPRAVVRLDEQSFETIKLYRDISPTAKYHNLRVPLGCCKQIPAVEKKSS